MTSRTLSSKLFFRELIKKVPMYVIAFLVYLFVGPITMMMTVTNYLASYSMAQKEMISNLVNYIQCYFMIGGLLAAGMAILFAFFCFGYVYSRSAVDLFHSLPIKREKLFAVKYLAGMIPSVLIILISYGLSACVLLANGLMVERVSDALLSSLIISLIGFFMVFHVAIIAIMLTGKLIVGVLGCGVLLGFTSVAISVIDVYYAYCFQTYYYMSDADPIWLELINPMAIFSLALQTLSEHIFDLLAIAVEAGAFLVIALILYGRRPSECTNKPLCYNASKPIIRFPLVILAALTAGMFITFEGNRLYEVWYWISFGVVAILAHIAIDMIFEQDVKDGLRHPIQLVLCLSMAVVISVIFQYDFFGYDRYIPAADEVASVSVSLNSIEQEVQLFDVEEVDGELDLVYKDMSEEFFKHLVMDDETAIRELAQEGIKQLNPNNSAIGRHRVEDNEESDYESGYERDPMNYYVVCYRLRSGRNVYRSYRTTMESTYDILADIYETDAYKSVQYQLEKYVDEGYLTGLEACDGLDSVVFDEKTIDPAEFIEVYLSDLQTRRLDDLRDSKPLMSLGGKAMDFYDNILCGYYILESDENTLAYLKEHGITESDYEVKIAPESVEEITINDYSVVSMNYGPDETKLTPKDDMDKIKSICDVMVSSSFSYTNYELHPYYNSLDVEVKFLTPSNVQTTHYFRIPLDVPKSQIGL